MSLVPETPLCQNSRQASKGGMDENCNADCRQKWEDWLMSLRGAVTCLFCVRPSPKGCVYCGVHSIAPRLNLLSSNLLKETDVKPANRLTSVEFQWCECHILVKEQKEWLKRISRK